MEKEVTPIIIANAIMPLSSFAFPQMAKDIVTCKEHYQFFEGLGIKPQT